VGVRVYTFPPKENLRVLAWLDDPLDEAFMDELKKGTNWEVTHTADETYFQQRILWPDPEGGIWYDVVFIPDDNTVDFDGPVTKWRLEVFNMNGGKLVYGGKTLWTNCWPVEDYYDRLMIESVGAYYWDPWGYVWRNGWQSPELVGEPEFTKMGITDISSPATAYPPFTVGYEVEYSGENYEQYVYRIYQSELIHTVAEWDNVPDGWLIYLWDWSDSWPAIVWWESFYGGGFPGPHLWGPTWLFNMRFAQSAMDNTTDPPNAGKEDWITFVRRVIGYEQVFESITLYVWRGPTLEEG